MTAPQSTAADRRRDFRVPTQARISFKAPDAYFAQEGSAIVEDLTGSGFRLRSESHLHPGEALTLRVPGELLPLHARVLWVREGGAPSKRAHATWIAGCEFEADSMARLMHFPPTRIPPGKPPVVAKRTLMAMATISVVVLLVYLFLRVVMLIGSSWIH